MMAGQRIFSTSMPVSASALFTTVWVASVIVNGIKRDQQDVQLRYELNVEWRDDPSLNGNGNDTVTTSTSATTKKPNFENKTLQTGTHLLRARSDGTANTSVEISERLFFDLAVNFVKRFVSFFAKDYLTKWQGNHTCYRNVCFLPQYGLGLEVGGPIAPEEENTTFLFFDSIESRGTEVNETTWDTFFTNYSGDISKPLVAIVHGLNGSRYSPWAITLRKALFQNVNCNVLVADWQERARFPNYAKAASSAPLVGVLLSLLLQKIIETSNCSLHPDNVHIIGFSLGAHAAGICGRHFYNTTDFSLGRITGLDPAGPLFERSNVCLSSNDAQFVDVIHTNAGKFDDGRLGLNKSIGHVDFYPNGGSEQPGCHLGYDTTDPACSHKRAQGLLIESLYRNCSFKSYYCANGWSAFLSGDCTKIKNSSYEGEMGYYSINETGRGNQYLNTSGTPPYCLNKTWPSSLL